jgi:hypothetical protein
MAILCRNPNVPIPVQTTWAGDARLLRHADLQWISVRLDNNFVMVELTAHDATGGIQVELTTDHQS